MSLILSMYLLPQLQAQIRISEVVSPSSKGLLDEDGDTSDWMELSHQGLEPINLQGHALSDDISEPTRWTFDEYTMQAKEHLVVFAFGKNRHITLPTEPPTFDPSNWPSLSIWLTADELEATQTGENRFVHEWRNQTPNSWTLQPPSNDTAPTLVQGALNEHSIYDTRRQWFQLTRPLVEWGHVR